MERSLRILFYLVLLVVLFGCASYLNEKAVNATGSDTALSQDIRFTTHLASIELFRQLQGEPLSAKFNEVQSIKVVWDKRSGHVFYINSKNYVYHFDFCSRELGFPESLDVFNSYNYTENPEQRYYLANLNYYNSLHLYALEFTSGTVYDPVSFNLFLNKVSESSYMKDSLYLLLGSGYLMNLAEKNLLEVPVVHPNDIYKNQHYQLLQGGECYGYLRLLENTDVPDLKTNARDILIIKGTPLRIPLCAAIITESIQTPLSHIQILARNRKIPAAVITDIWTNNYPEAFINKPVKLSLNATGYTWSLCSKEAVDSFFALQQPPLSNLLQFDSLQQQLLTGKKLRMYAAAAVGTKAAALGELQHLSVHSKVNWKVPEGLFAIPFYYYLRHISHANIQNALQQVYHAGDRHQISEALKTLRSAIKSTPLQADLLHQIENIILQNNCGYSYRFRSSSNAEDMDGFSGAGLYTSKTGILYDKDKTIEKAILSVWASVWSDEAYFERSYRNINQQSVAMAIACHRNFPEESANGVAITQNLYRPGFVGFTVNVQSGETSVVNPPAGISCEQFILSDLQLINPLNKGIGADYIAASSLLKGKRVLTETQLTILYNALMDVKEHFYAKTEWGKGMFEDFALDIEFKFDSNGLLYLKQVRPYPAGL